MEMNIQDKSKKLSLNKNDGLKILQGGLIAISGALLTYATDIIPNIDWGEWSPVVVAVSGILINTLRKLLQGK